jgi:hypothetical protein
LAHTITNITDSAIRLTDLQIGTDLDVKNKFQIEPGENIDLTSLRTPSGAVFSSQRLRDAVYNGAVAFVVGGSPLSVADSIDYFTNYNFQPSGGLVPDEVIQINTDYAAVESKNAIVADAAANNIKITLPAAPTKGVKWIIKRQDKSNFVLEVVSTAPATIDGVTNSVVIKKTGANKLNNSLTFLFDGADYQVI